MDLSTVVFHGEALARYHFGDDHPFGPQRHDAFMSEFYSQQLDQSVLLRDPVTCSDDDLALFHHSDYIDKVKKQSETGQGFLDYGDTPAFKGVYETSKTVVGSTLEALRMIMSSEVRNAFVPIAGLHHARRNRAAGFCVFNDCGVVIEALRRYYGIRRIAYVDIDAHHGDGVFYSFEDDPDLFIVDIHESGDYLYPGTGYADETGTGVASGSKLNLPLPPQAGDDQAMIAWETGKAFLEQARPEFILLQCGADSLAGDPITHLAFSEQTHYQITRSLCGIADRHAGGKVLATGGGGYNLKNIGRAWCAVVRALSESNP